jgi:hypothetical protein
MENFAEARATGMEGPFAASTPAPEPVEDAGPVVRSSSKCVWRANWRANRWADWGVMGTK